MTASQPPPFGRELGEAARAASALHLALLDKAGITFNEWVVLHTFGTSEPVIRRDALETELAGRLQADAESIRTLLDDMLLGDLIRDDPETSEVAMSEKGKALYWPLRASVEGLTTDLLHDLDPAAVETTRQVLRDFTVRAVALSRS